MAARTCLTACDTLVKTANLEQEIDLMHRRMPYMSATVIPVRTFLEPISQSPNIDGMSPAAVAMTTHTALKHVKPFAGFMSWT